MPTFETPDPISVTIELAVGDIRIAASDRADTVVEVRPSDPDKKGDVTAAEQTRVDYANGKLLIKAPRGWRQFSPWRGGESIDVQIDLPAGSRLRGEAAVATLRCTGRLGECHYQASVGDVHIDHAGPVELRTRAGDISVDRAIERAEITTGTGAVSIGTIDGTAVIKNANGQTTIGSVTGDLRISAANGKIDVDQAQASVTAKTANGDVRLGEVARSAIVAETAKGNLDIGILDGVAAWLDLNTRFGDIRNDLDATEGPEPGEDAVEVRAHTSYGDITVGRLLRSSTGKEAE